MSIHNQHKIRSFVMRAGKLTSGQKRAVDELLPQLQLDEVKTFNKQEIFSNNNPVWMDIGFGNGESLIHAAQLYPDVNFIGIEVHTPGVGHLLLNIEKLGLKNIRIYHSDSVEVITKCFEENTLDAIHIYFPDPWHKKRHHKRRLVNESFMKLISKKLKNDGRLHLATDWQNYAEQMLEVIGQFPQFVNTSLNGGFIERPDWRPITKFERRGFKLGHQSFDLVYRITKED